MMIRSGVDAAICGGGCRQGGFDREAADNPLCLQAIDPAADGGTRGADQGGQRADAAAGILAQQVDQLQIGLAQGRLRRVAAPAG